MTIKYNIEIDSHTVATTLKKIINQTYKLLPMREEGIDWQKPLTTILEELSGMSRLFVGQQDKFFPILCKLEGLFELTEADDFLTYRGVIFECLGLMNELCLD